MDQLNCSACHTALDASALNERLGILTCPNCGAIYSLSPASQRGGSVPAMAPQVSMPKGFQVERRGGELSIRFGWFHPKVFFFLFFAIFWNVFLFGWYAAPTPIFFKLFALPHLCVGLGMAYYVLASFVNRTTVRADGRELTVRHGPLPWWPMPTIPARDLQQLYCERKVSYSRRGGRSVNYALRAQTAHQGSQLVLSGLKDVNQGLWLERELEQHMRIEDAPVAGEVAEKGGRSAIDAY